MKKEILIIGGMGPQASLLLHKRILDKAAELGAVNGSDFPTIAHLSLPIDDFINDKSKMKVALNEFKQGLGYLWQPKFHSYSSCM